MEKRKTYRSMGALLLLLLYFFVAIPMNYWHNHSKQIVPSQITSFSLDISSETKTYLSKKSIPVAKKECVICAYHYTLHVGTKIMHLPIEKSINDKNLISYYASPLSQNTGDSFMKRGPPSLSIA